MWQYLFGGLLALVGASFLRQNRQSRRRLEASRHWRSVQGEVTRAETAKTRNRRGTVQAKIAYTYVVAGTTYTGKKITIGGEVSTSGGARARAWLDRYPAGSKPTVYYDPADPGVACLERTHEGAAMELVAGILGIALGGALLFGWLV